MSSSFPAETTVSLLIQATRLQRTKANELLAKLDLYAGQEVLLFQLQQQDGMSISELAGRLSVQKATLTRMLERLENRNMIQKENDEKDHRTTRIYLTPEGRQTVGQALRIWEQIETQTSRGLTPAEVKQLQALLRKIIENYQ